MRGILFYCLLDLGLGLSYDNIKANIGELEAYTKEDEFAEFVIKLPFAKFSEV